MLKDSLDNDVISESEYKSKINDLEKERKKQQHLEEEKKEINIKKKLLDTLLSKGLLTQEEYKIKLDELLPVLMKNDFSINNFNVAINDIYIPQKLKQYSLDISFLKYLIKEIDYYINFFKSKQYPFYAALILDDLNVELTPDLIENLLNVAKRDFRLETINEVLETIKTH